MKTIKLLAVLMALCFVFVGCIENESVEVIEEEDATPTVLITPVITASPVASATPSDIYEVVIPTITPEKTSAPTRAPITLPSVTHQGETEKPKSTSTPQNTNTPQNKEKIYLDKNWEFADFSEINSGYAVLYRATSNRKNIVIGVNAGHGTEGGTSKKTYCHPDKTPKLTSGTTAAGSVKAVAVSGGMTFKDGTPEKKITLQTAQILKDLLLQDGYDVLMIRDGDDVQLDNVARTVICNNVADCHIALHWDGDGLDYDKGCFYLSVPDGLKKMYPVSKTWQKSHALGDCLISGLKDNGNKIFSKGTMNQDLTQTSFSTVPSIDIELGNQSSKHDEKTLLKLAQGLKEGIDEYFL